MVLKVFNLKEIYANLERQFEKRETEEKFLIAEIFFSLNGMFLILTCIC